MPFLASLATFIILTNSLITVIEDLLNAVTTLSGNGFAGYWESIQFFNPYGVAINSEGTIYVADLNQRIRKITPAGVVTTLAGNGSLGFEDGIGTNASFKNPHHIALDSSGNIFVTEKDNHCIRKVTPEGVVSIFVGSTTASPGFADGSGTNVRFNSPRGIAVDSSGIVYVADTSNDRIRKVTQDGVVTTFAGSLGGYVDETGVNARFNDPWGLAIDSSGNLYVGDGGNHRIRMITPDAVVSTIAGNGTTTFANGNGTSATFNQPHGVVLDTAGNLYVADYGNHRIRKIDTSRNVTTLAGNGTSAWLDGIGTNNSFRNPSGITIDSEGTLYVADYGNHRIRKISPTGVVTSPYGSPQLGYSDSASPAIARFNDPFGLTFDSSGNMYVADTGNHRIRKITPAGVVTTVAGNGSTGFLNGTGTNAQINGPRGIAVDSTGNLYVAETGNHRIRKITPAGVVTNFAGTGGTTFADGPGTSATFNQPHGITIDSAGTLYVADLNNNRIRRIDTNANVSTFAGNGASTSVDGEGASATFNRPRDVTIDSTGNLYVTEQSGNRIRKIDTNGNVTTLAGTSFGYLDGVGTNARFNTPQGIAVDSAGVVYVADGGNQVIRKIDTSANVTSFAGNKTTIVTFRNGVGTNANFTPFQGIALDSSGNLYVADTNNSCIRKITPAAVVTTFSGISLTSGYSDGAWFNNPSGLATDWDGVVYVADENNNRIRNITPEGVVNTFAGSGSVGALNSTLLASTFNKPYAVTLDSVKNAYITDTSSHRVRKITFATGVVTSFSGNGSVGSANGASGSTSFNILRGITVDLFGNVYVTEEGGHRVRKLTSAGVSTTLAGTGSAGSVDGTGTNASFNKPFGAVADLFGNVYVSDTYNHRIRRITADGTVTTLAGSTQGFADGSGTNAQFNLPETITIDPLGVLYVVEEGGHRVRKITPAGVVTTLAGTGTAGFTNGAGLSATFSNLVGITVDRFQNAYVSETGNHSVRKIADVYTLPDNNENVITFAGSSQGFLNATGIGSQFYGPIGIAVDSIGNIYIGDTYNHRIRKIDRFGVVTTLAGSGNATPFTDATGVSATFYNPQNVAVDSVGNIYVPDFGNHRIRKITSAGVVTTLAGNGNTIFANGAGTNATFFGPRGVAVDRLGNVYVADAGNNRIRKIDIGGIVTTLAGSGSAEFADGIGSNASFNNPFGVTVDFEGNVYVVDGGNQRIRKITPTGIVTTLAGNASAAFNNGSGVSASFNNPYGISVDSNGSVYIGDYTNNRIRKITSDGVVSTLAGNGTTTFADGTGTNATFNQPWGVTVDAAGSVYVADFGNHRIRKIGTQAVQIPLNRAVVTLFAGNGTAAFADGTGTNARFNDPRGVAVDLQGNVYIADTTNNRIRKISPLGVVTILAGQAAAGSTDGAGTSATFNGPWAVAVDSAGTVYVTDTGGNRIRKITPGGVVTTLAGSGASGSSTDGTGASATFWTPQGIAVDSAGTVYVADNSRIRKITPGGVVSTFAGNGIADSTVNGTGTNAGLSGVNRVAVDLEGNLYITSQASFFSVRKITPAGVVTTLAGGVDNGSTGFSDGTGSNAIFSGYMNAVTVDPMGTVYVVDYRRIRKITPAGVVTTLAGGASAGSTNATGTSASFDNPWGIGVDSGGILYVSELADRIRKIQ
jgi:streptogramin lyase